MITNLYIDRFNLHFRALKDTSFRWLDLRKLAQVRVMSRYNRPTRSERPPGEHLLVYDGECGFCRWSAGFVRRRARVAVKLVPFTELAGWGVLTSLDAAQVARSAHYVTPDGVEYHGGESITRSLRLVRFGAAAGLLDLWGLALLRELVYALVAGNRSLASRLLRRPSR